MMQFHLMYIDPGSGSYLVQVIIAAVLGVAFYFKTIWLRIKMFFTGRKKGQPGNQETNE
ncbi:MAG TPA: hypothetical protein VL307_19255 [Chitinophagaceae bacterium]|nr:hypothetical protein [Chitinophagaceae bacterium]